MEEKRAIKEKAEEARLLKEKEEFEERKRRAIKEKLDFAAEDDEAADEARPLASQAPTPKLLPMYSSAQSQEYKHDLEDRSHIYFMHKDITLTLTLTLTLTRLHAQGQP